ncbi:U11/U12 small nuclear ribonucleoprotein 25 kDa protein isoform X1 [Colossoma macropomum]|uniref:U11/U12 small nuclear ribonucleoprotein 25 kDa protein isoform X1 n=1 Tax=Colossoma macropomum TaxID=42526 RepID=UPI0018655301|nr:U11/U12 small nuclear ribonucleoprotein 25 kDa protein isoform X1 [Colossoma macropomum]
MPPPSKEQQLESVCSELHELSLRRQQLNDRLSLLAMLKGFRKNAGFQEEGDDSTEQDECEKIAEELKKLSERKRELQAKKDALERNHVQFTGATFIPAPLDGPDTPTSFGSQIFFVDKPPSFPAPQVILDVQKLPPHASQTQCPFCEQYITTEISTITGNTTWLVCMVCTFICCIAGCCLIPFCMDSFKDIVHKCPKCRSQIHTCKKM